ncbi:hypothetical protein Hanom_Chr15g01368551 [Helianthus anomalus]
MISLASRGVRFLRIGDGGRRRRFRGVWSGGDRRRRFRGVSSGGDRRRVCWFDRNPCVSGWIVPSG